MHIEADRTLIPAHSVAVRHLTIAVAAPVGGESGAGGVAASDVALEIACSPGVSVFVLNGLPVESSRLRTRVSLGHLAPRQEVVIVAAVSCRPRLLEDVVFVDCRVWDAGGVLFAEPMRVAWRAVDPLEDARQPANEHVLERLTDVLAERGCVTAAAAVRRGDRDGAVCVLRNIMEHLWGLAPTNAHVQAAIVRLRQRARELEPPARRGAAAAPARLVPISAPRGRPRARGRGAGFRDL